MVRKSGPYNPAADPPVATPSTPPMDPREGFRPASVEALMAAFKRKRGGLVVAGHTGWGVYKDAMSTIQRDASDVLHVRGVPELTAITAGSGAVPSLVVGAGAAIAALVDALTARAGESVVCAPVADHLSLVAGHQVWSQRSRRHSHHCCCPYPSFPHARPL